MTLSRGPSAGNGWPHEDGAVSVDLRDGMSVRLQSPPRDPYIATITPDTRRTILARNVL